MEPREGAFERRFEVFSEATGLDGRSRGFEALPR